MASAFDNRLITFEVTFKDGQKITYNQDFYIVASGMKFTNGNLGECIVRIDNIDKKIRDLLVTKTSPWAKPREYVNIVISAGRESIGTFVLFEGQAFASNPSQPPDIALTFKSFAQNYLLGNMGAFSAPQISSMKSICEQIAKSNNLTLDFQAKDKNIENYSFTGASLKQIDKINQMGGVVAFVDNSTLIVLDSNTPRKSQKVLINSATGMVGVPEITELGVRVRMLINNEIKVGDPVTVKSVINPATNGDYFIFRLSFEIASREEPFYWIMDLRPAPVAIGFGL